MRAIIAAVAQNGVIGYQGKMPWYYPDDLKWFQSLTVGHTVVMGRKTYDSLPNRYKPLPDRNNIVLSRSITPSGFYKVSNKETGKSSRIKFVSELEIEDSSSIFYIGGAEIYSQAMSLVDRVFLTKIPRDRIGDTWFPYWPLENFGWENIKEHGKTADGLEFLEYRRKI